MLFNAQSTDVSEEKRQVSVIGQGHMRTTDIRSQSESEEFAEPLSAVISALVKALMVTLTGALNIVLSANEVGADVLQFIHVISVHGT